MLQSGGARCKATWRTLLGEFASFLLLFCLSELTLVLCVLDVHAAELGEIAGTSSDKLFLH
jgi:hypothetical protein